MVISMNQKQENSEQFKPNRRIDFLARDLETNQWISDYTKIIAGDYDGTKCKSNDNRSHNSIWANREMTKKGISFDSSSDDCQLLISTRIKDQNGKTIYEGDIISFMFDYYYDPTEESWIEGIGPVVWDNENASLSVQVWDEISEKYLHLGFKYLKEIEILGNRFDNPELLKDVKQ